MGLNTNNLFGNLLELHDHSVKMNIHLRKCKSVVFLVGVIPALLQDIYDCLNKVVKLLQTVL